MKRMRRALAAGVALMAAMLVAACGGGPPAPAPPRTRGAGLYLANCIACHRADGGGVPTLQPPLAGTPVTLGDPTELLDWVMYGRRPAALPAGAYSGFMPRFSYLSDEELAALLTHVRSSFGNRAAPVTPAMVAAARAAHRGV